MAARWLPSVLSQIRQRAVDGEVRLTAKALAELRSLELALAARDVCDILSTLTLGDFHGRRRSRVSNEWLYIFKPVVAAVLLYVKIVLREDCIVISFHQDEPRDDHRGAKSR